MIYMSNFKIIDSDGLDIDNLKYQDFVIDRVVEVAIIGDQNNPLILNLVKDIEYDLEYKVALTNIHPSAAIYNYCSNYASVNMVVKFLAVYVENVQHLVKLEVEFRDLKLSNVISSLNTNSNMVVEFVDFNDGK